MYKFKALRVLPAVTRLTVYRRLRVFDSTRLNSIVVLSHCVIFADFSTSSPVTPYYSSSLKDISSTSHLSIKTVQAVSSGMV